MGDPQCLCAKVNLNSASSGAAHELEHEQGAAKSPEKIANPDQLVV